MMMRNMVNGEKEGTGQPLNFERWADGFHASMTCTYIMQIMLD